MLRKIGLCLLVGFFVLGTGHSALAFKQFYDQWVERYVDESDESDENKEFIQVVTGKKTKCLVCHRGKKKKNRNAYGRHFAELLTKEDKKDTEKIVEALRQVGALPSDPEADEETVVTFDELIAKRQLPGGDLEDLQQEPEAEEGKTTNHATQGKKE